MGTSVPPDPEELIDGKWYHVGVGVYIPGPPFFDCINRAGAADGCVTGFNLKAWIRNDNQCTQNTLFPTGAGHTQKILRIDGPFDNVIDCNADVFP